MQKKIGSSDVTIAMGDLTAIIADAYVIPEFAREASYGGVGGAVARAGGKGGLDSYQKLVEQNGELRFGQVVLTPSGGGNARTHLHVVSVGSGTSDEFDTVQTAFFNALKVAEQNRINRIVAPAMGTGIIGELTGEQSAKAMMSALHQYQLQGGKALDVFFAIYGSRTIFDAFCQTLDAETYKTAQKEEGKKEFSKADWVTGMARDAAANRRAFDDNDINEFSEQSRQ